MSTLLRMMIKLDQGNDTFVCEFIDEIESLENARLCQQQRAMGLSKNTANILRCEDLLDN